MTAHDRPSSRVERTSDVGDRAGIEWEVRHARRAALALIVLSFASRGSHYDLQVQDVALSVLLRRLALGLLAAAVLGELVRALRHGAGWTRQAVWVLMLAEWGVRELPHAPFAPLAELATRAAAVVFIVTVAVIVVRGLRTAGDLPERQVARALSRFVDPALAGVLATELVILTASLTLLFRKTPTGPDVFGYWRTTLYRLIIPLLPLILVPDWLIFEIVVPKSMSWLRAAHAVGSVYLVFWALGVYGLLRTRPNRIHGDVLEIHCGVFKFARVPLRAIDAARAVVDTDLPASSRLDIKGSPRVELTLSEPVQTLRGLQLLEPTQRLLLSADDTTGLCHAIERRRAQLTAERRVVGGA